jgi:DNA replication protein DnaC
MDNLNFTRSRALNNISSRKLQEALDAIKGSADDLPTQNVKLIAANRYAESNIPLEYWTLKMDRDFSGDPRLLAKYNEYAADLKAAYIDGRSLCLAGGHGRGKTMTVTCILKKASQKGYSCLYTTLSDIVAVLTQASGEDKFLARRELALVDFLVIDEFDSRFMPSENAADLYARSLESVFRTRSQNKLPTLMCTNSPNIKETFTGSLKASIGSLMSGYLPIFPVLGDDFRDKKDSK